MSFQQALSGLNATSKNLDVIGNNIANASTYGFKNSRAEFADMYANSLGSASGSTTGIGVNVAAVAQQFTQGNITATENPMDIAINGAGFFQVTDGSGPPLYSRNGQFKVDRDGYIVNNEGLQLMGFPEGSGSASAEALRLPTGGVPANATSAIEMEVSLDSGGAFTNPTVQAQQRLDDAQTAYDAAADALAADPTNQTLIDAADDAQEALTAATDALADISAGPQIDFNDRETYSYVTSLTIYDSLGSPITMSYYFQKTASDTYDVYITANGAPISADADDNPQPSTTVSFRGNPAGAPVSPVEDVLVDIAAGTNANGAATLPLVGVAINLDGMRQSDGSAGVTNISQDGYARGELSSIIVEGDGTVMARYSNGQSRPAGQIELATFRNPQGLQPRGNNTWIATFASGTPVPGQPGSGNLGVLQAGALEEANVDLTKELVSMITAQRNYQANAQTIKTIDAVMQTLVNLR